MPEFSSESDLHAELLRLLHADAASDAAIELEVSYWHDPRALQPSGVVRTGHPLSLLSVAGHLVGVKPRTVATRNAQVGTDTYRMVARRSSAGTDVTSIALKESDKPRRGFPATQFTPLDAVAILDPSWLLAGWSLEYRGDETVGGRRSARLTASARRKSVRAVPPIARRAETLTVLIGRSNHVLLDLRAYVRGSEYVRLTVTSFRMDDGA